MESSFRFKLTIFRFKKEKKKNMNLKYEALKWSKNCNKKKKVFASFYERKYFIKIFSTFVFSPILFAFVSFTSFSPLPPPPQNPILI